VNQAVIADTPRCPLCGSGTRHKERVVDTAAIRAYWQAFCYSLDAEFAPLPETLTGWRCGQCQLGWFDPPLIGGPSLYAALAAWPPYYRRQAWEWPVAIEILARAGTQDMIEIGAGTGEFLAQAALRIARVAGLEFNTAAIDRAKAEGRPVTSRRLADIAAKPEAIAAFQVLEHVGDPAGFIAMCRDALVERGLLILAVPNDDGVIGAIEGDFLNLPPHHATRWRRATFEAVGSIFGLRLVDHRVEPLRRTLHRHYRLRHLRPARTVRGKIGNSIRRHAIDVVSPFAFLRDRRRLGGETQLAVFRKER
jgi:SAM-dependent methyltransferase